MNLCESCSNIDCKFAKYERLVKAYAAIKEDLEKFTDDYEADYEIIFDVRVTSCSKHQP